MKITQQGGRYWTNYKKFTPLRPKHRPTGQRRPDTDVTGLIWENATMDWDNLVDTWGQLA